MPPASNRALAQAMRDVSGPLSLACLIALASAPAGVVGDLVTVVATPEFKDIDYGLVGPLSGQTEALCSTPVTQGAGYGVDLVTQDNTTVTVTLRPQNASQGLALLSQTVASPALRISNSSASLTTLTYAAAGYSSPLIDLTFALLQPNGSRICTWPIRLQTDLSRPTVINAADYPAPYQNITLTAFKPPNGTDPRRNNCLLNVTQLAQPVERALTILVPAGSNTTLTAPDSAPLYGSSVTLPARPIASGRGSSSVPGLYTYVAPMTNDRLVYAVYNVFDVFSPATSSGRFSWALGDPAQCNITVNFVPTNVARAPPPPPPASG